MRYRIFVGSSSEELVIARAVQQNLARYGHIVKVWEQGIFSVGRSAFESLLEALDKFDAAVFIFAPNDLVTMRGTSFDAVRDNVVFELGLFAGRFGRDRTAWISPEGQTQLRVASDLVGLLPATYTPPNDGDWTSALAIACDRIQQMLMESARKRSGSVHPLSNGAVRDCLPRLNDILLHIARTITTNDVMVRDDRVETLPDNSGFCLRLNSKATLTISYGRIEESSLTPEEDTVVALPANEFFDDECITDQRSALGAFVSAHCRDGSLDDLKKRISEQRNQLPRSYVERETGVFRESYGVGSALYVRALRDSGPRLILCAVTRMRAKEGIKAEPAYVFAAVQAVSRIMNDLRLARLHVPLIGSGHGDMDSQVALLCLALALATTPDIRHANIVVFRKTPDSESDVPPEMARKILAFAGRHART